MRAARYVLADLVRNPRRTLAATVGVALGVGLFCGVLFFVDGLSASMTQRAVAPLAIDMQRIVGDGDGASLVLEQVIDPAGPRSVGDRATVQMDVRNVGDTPVHDVTVRSLPAAGLDPVAGSARRDGQPLDGADNPFAVGLGQTGHNLGTLAPGSNVALSYEVTATEAVVLDDTTIRTAQSSRESPVPFRANEPPAVALDVLAAKVAGLDGIVAAHPLAIGDLGVGRIAAHGATSIGPAKIFGFDEAFARGDETIEVSPGSLGDDVAVVSAELARDLGLALGDGVTVGLPDGASMDVVVGGVADLSRSRSLFSSRRGGDLETFDYVPHAVVVSPRVFAEVVSPAFERAASDGGGRLKSPPIHEVDITVDRALLAADPTRAAVQTAAIGAAVEALESDQGYLLDNITNTLRVASADATVATRLFVFLGVPGAMLAAMLAVYAGTVLAEAQRREQAVLRVRGASHRDLLGMLALRAGVLAAVGSLVGVGAGWIAAASQLGRASLALAGPARLVRSGVVGALVGFVATGLALYLTGRRSVAREIDEDRARLATKLPVWRRARLDLVGLAVVVVATAAAVRTNAFDGASGSVYFGRGVELRLPLLVLPVTVWITGSLLVARLVGVALARTSPASSPHLGNLVPRLVRLSIGRRPWAITNGAIIVGLIVALATCLAGFTASYDAAKVRDARFATGADVRITPAPTVDPPWRADDGSAFEVGGVSAATPVVFAPSNVIIRSARTSDPANLAALDPVDFPRVAPFSSIEIEGPTGPGNLAALLAEPDAILLSRDMANFLRVSVGDPVDVLLARSSDAQLEVSLVVAGRFDRLPGFPEGADAVMAVDRHTELVSSVLPDFFLAATDDPDAAALERAVQAVQAVQAGPGAAGGLTVETRATTLDRDQSSLAALNVAGLVTVDSAFSLAMAVVTIGIFVFGLLLQRRREYVTLRALGVSARVVLVLVAAEAATVAAAGATAGLVVGGVMGRFFVAVLRPLFVLDPTYVQAGRDLARPVLLTAIATVVAAALGARLVNRLEPTELARDE